MSTTRDVDVNRETVPPSQRLIERIADLEGVDHTELDPLYEVIDSDALDRLVETTGRNNSTLRIEFRYVGYDVTVTDDGSVSVDDGGVCER